MRHPDRWLAMLRIVVGVWFAKSITSKFTWSVAGGVIPVPRVSERWINFLPERLSEYVANNPPDWYREFLVNTAIPNSDALARATAVGEVAVGVSLTLGLLTVLGALGGLWLIVNYFLASLGAGFNTQGFHVLLMACMIAFIAARAGRTWGLDGWLRRRYPRSILARLHLG